MPWKTAVLVLGCAATLAACGDAPRCEDPATLAVLKGLFTQRLAQDFAAASRFSGDLVLQVEPNPIGHRDAQAAVSICSAAIRVGVDAAAVERTLKASVEPYWRLVGRRWREAMDMPSRDDLAAQIGAVAEGAPTVTARQKARLDRLLGVDVAADTARALDAAARLTAGQHTAVTGAMGAMQQVLGAFDPDRQSVALQVDYTVGTAVGGDGEKRMVVDARFDDKSIDGMRALELWLLSMREVDAQATRGALPGAPADTPADTPAR